MQLGTLVVDDGRCFGQFLLEGMGSEILLVHGGGCVKMVMCLLLLVL